jgi:DNA-binding SARP family transcriptional activator
VFKRLLTTPGRRLSRLDIQEDLWPEASMELADRYLNNAVMVSRQIIGKTLVETIGPLYEIAGQSQVWSDLDACRALVREAENQGCTTPEALPLLEEAFSYFERGKCLEDEAERWCHAVRADAERVQRQCHLWLADSYKGVGKLWQAGEVYRTMIHALPGDEEALQSWMQMLARHGKRQEALKCYQDMKDFVEAQGFSLSNELEQMVTSLDKQPMMEQSPRPAWVTVSPGQTKETQPELPIAFSEAIAQGIIEAIDRLQDLRGYNMDHLRRQLLQLFSIGASATVALSMIPVGNISQTLLSGLNAMRFTLPGEETITHLEQLNDTLWHLVNDDQTKIVMQMLASYLPQMAAFAKEPSPNQKRIARLVASGYILAAEAEKENVSELEKYCEQAIAYSQLAEDEIVQVDALRQGATISLIAKRPLKSLHLYQQAVPLVDRVSPLLRSRIYLGLALAQARCQQTQPALEALEMAHEHYPSQPENDPVFRYLAPSSSLSALHLYEALTYTDLQQPEPAWNALMQVDGIHPKIPTTESTRLEVLNLQAKTAASLGDLEKSCFYLQASVQAAKSGGYRIWQEEAYDVYLFLLQTWPHEKVVKNLLQPFWETV